MLNGLLVAVSRGKRQTGLDVGLDMLAVVLAGVALVDWAAAPILRRLSSGSVLGGAASVDLLVGFVVACAAWLAAAGLVASHRGRRRAVLPRGRSLALVAGASLGDVVVLAGDGGPFGSSVPGVCAILSLAACGVRMGLAFAQLRELTSVREQLLTDDLTGAANRKALYAELERLLTVRMLGVGEPPRGFSLALVDLDHLKEVNDTFGHPVGDALLQEVVRRFTSALEQSAGPYLVCRLGGDEFAILLYDVRDHEAAVGSGRMLLASLGKPMRVDDVVVHIRASIGISVAPGHGSNRADLVFAADSAMHAAKTATDPVRLYAPSVVDNRRGSLEIAESLFTAIEERRLVIEYQPVRRVDGALAAAKALVRWNHSTGRRFQPEDFLAVTERYRLGHQVTSHVIDLVLADLARWRSQGSQILCGLNVSSSDLQSSRLVKTVAQAMERHGVPAGSLIVEIPQRVVMADAAAALATMVELTDTGVALAIDNYGTSHSSLQYLLRLPVDLLKLDKTFSKSLTEDCRVGAIVRSTVDLAHALGMQLVADGVEDEATLAGLTDLGCEFVQGTHVGLPVSGEEFAHLLERERLRVGQQTQRSSRPTDGRWGLI